jgi:hypothetical protein
VPSYLARELALLRSAVPLLPMVAHRYTWLVKVELHCKCKIHWTLKIYHKKCKYKIAFFIQGNLLATLDISGLTRYITNIILSAFYCFNVATRFLKLHTWVTLYIYWAVQVWPKKQESRRELRVPSAI